MNGKVKLEQGAKRATNRKSSREINHCQESLAGVNPTSTRNLLCRRQAVSDKELCRRRVVAEERKWEAGQRKSRGVVLEVRMLELFSLWSQ